MPVYFSIGDHIVLHTSMQTLRREQSLLYCASPLTHCSGVHWMRGVHKGHPGYHEPVRPRFGPFHFDSSSPSLDCDYRVCCSSKGRWIGMRESRTTSALASSTISNQKASRHWQRAVLSARTGSTIRALDFSKMFAGKCAVRLIASICCP